MTHDKQFIKVLLISNNEEEYLVLKNALELIKGTKYKIERTQDYAEAYERITTDTDDVYIVDFHEGVRNELHLIKKVTEEKILVPFIIFTESQNDELDILLMNQGSSDYLIKDNLTPAVLEKSIRYAYNINEAFKKVSESEYKFRGLFERSVDALFITTKTYSIQDANDSFLKLLSYQKSDIKDLDISKLFLKTEDYLFFVDELLSETPLKNWEVILLDAFGKKLECQVAAVPIHNFEGETNGYQCIIHDLTQRKKAERELLHAELLSVTGKMARSMAHEVRNPLTNLTLALDQVKSELEEMGNDEITMLTDIIGRNAKRIDSIIKEMLSNATLDEVKTEEMPIEVAINESLDIVKDRLTLKEIKLDKKVPHHLPPVKVDKSKMQIAITNLLVNAIEAMEDRKGILNITALHHNGMMTLEIMDNGKGIDEDSLKKLFNPFFTKKHGGTGLGLTNTKNIINAHGGEITIESELDKGTTFSIKLPLHQ